MRSFSFAKTWTPLGAEPTPSEAYVMSEFGEAIAFAAAQWQGFEASNRQADAAWTERFALRQRLLAFLAGPIGAALEARFPKIAATGDEADALTGMTGNTRAIGRLIVGEAIIAAGGGSRGEVRAALAD